jgi:hypothetical protein
MLDSDNDRSMHVVDLLNTDIWHKAGEGERIIGSKAFALVDALISAKIAPYRVDQESAVFMHDASVKALIKECTKLLPEKTNIPKIRFISAAVEKLVECDADDDDYRRHYACMVSSAMHSDTAEKFHPAFPAVLSQLSREDLKMIDGYSVSSAPSRHIFFCKVHLSDGGFAENLAHRTFINQGTSWREVGMLNAVDYVSNLTRLSIVNVIHSEKEWSLAEFAAFLRKNGITADIETDGDRRYLVDRGIDVMSVREQIDLFPLSKFGYEFVRACGIF